MSMQLLTFLQLIYIIVIYLGVVVLIPAAVFFVKFKDQPFYVRYSAYASIGNFYLMNLVFFLQLFKISNRATLILGVIIPALMAIAVFNWRNWVKASLVSAGEATHNVIVSTMGFRLFFTRILQGIWSAIRNTSKAILENLATKWYEWIGTIIIIALVCWQYGSNLFQTYGYTASDMLVHNYWVNAMGQNNIFVGGVYPHGFHCIIYYFHAVFGIETYVLFRLFSLVEALLIHLSVLFFLRLVCKTHAMAYVATALYLTLGVWSGNVYARFYSALPQEYGMIFILPSILFLILFFRARKEENGGKGLRQESTKFLVIFSINISLTLAAHFYDTIALGLFCVAIAVGFVRLVLRKDFFGRIVAAGILGLAFAVLPMWWAYELGTPLEGSLRWGMSIMQGWTPGSEVPSSSNDSSSNGASSSDQGISTAQTGTAPQQGDENGEDVFQVNYAAVNTGNLFQDVNAGINGGTVSQISQAGIGAAPLPVQKTSLVSKVKSLCNTLFARIDAYVFYNGSTRAGKTVFFIIGFGLLFGLLNLFRREKEYGSVLIAAAVNVLLFCVVLISKELGIPVLMDQHRCAIYFGFYLVVLGGLVMDGILYLFIGWVQSDVFQKLAPVLFAVALFFFLASTGWIRMPQKVNAFQKNGAIICVANILRDNKPFTFTIVSANDELRMTEDYGYHYEVIDLLKANYGSYAKKIMTIPTNRVYVFIEKIPSDYDEGYAGSGQSISVEGAKKPLPFTTGINMYKGEKRHIVMSKLYFWAQTFGRMFENEMSVYYEDDEFICYEIRQSMDRPFDMSFNYGYNY